MAIELIKQRGAHDCGVAAAAMAFGMTYEDALKALRDPNLEVEEFEGQTHCGITPEEFSFLAFKRGAQCCVVTINEVQPKDHWAYVWRDTFVRAKIEDLNEYLWRNGEVIGILGVDSLNSPGNSHWIVVQDGMVFDPSTRKTYEPGMILPVQVAILVRRAAPIYMVVHHVQVGDEVVLGATTDKVAARAYARQRNKETGTRNFECVEVSQIERKTDAGA